MDHAGAGYHRHTHREETVKAYISERLLQDARAALADDAGPQGREILVRNPIGVKRVGECDGAVGVRPAQAPVAPGEIVSLIQGVERTC
jgi:hypothetical protein